MANKVTTIFEAVDHGFKSTVKGMSTAMDEAHGFTGKFKAGIGALKQGVDSFISSPLGASVAIGTASAAIEKAGQFALEAVTKFSDYGLEVGKVSDATGLSTEASSRWMDVAKQMDIDVGSLETGVGKMNKTIGNSPKLFASAGIEIAKTSSGATDVNRTFLNTIDVLKGIEDPTKRAALAAHIFGKGWQSMAELIDKGSGALGKSLDAVNKAKILSPEQVQEARDFHESVVKLKDAAGAFAMTLGKDLAPALTEVANLGVKVADVFNTLNDKSRGVIASIDEWVLNTASKFIPGLTTAAQKQNELAQANSETERETRKLTTAMGDVSQATTETDRETRKLADSMGNDLPNATTLAANAALAYKDQVDKTKDQVQRDIDDMKAKWAELTGAVNADKSWRELQQQMKDLHDAGVKAMEDTAAGASGAAKEVYDVGIKTDDLKLKVIDYGNTVAGLPPEKVTTLLAQIDAGNLAAVQQELADAVENHTYRINAHLDSITVDGETHVAGSSGPVTPTAVTTAVVRGGPHATGGPVTAGVAYPVGEKGPETFVPDTNGTILPNGFAGGGNTYHVTVNAGVGAGDGYRLGQLFVKAVAEYDRRNGTKGGAR